VEGDPRTPQRNGLRLLALGRWIVIQGKAQRRFDTIATVVTGALLVLIGTGVETRLIPMRPGALAMTAILGVSVVLHFTSTKK
jgi:hypothetical protein